MMIAFAPLCSQRVWLLTLLVSTFAADGVVVMSLDDTIERRWLIEGCGPLLLPVDAAADSDGALPRRSRLKASGHSSERVGD
ncbi:hypothetical protein [Nodosilinea sp. LEGE 07088]|uniref:hypothetical protein n=1 Tax=Nodosilinea sp. LEGE 07088 TaxID=2777968 RepID=UPI00187FAB7B|nr:hypothetical protein [Nodosilinea sp. LEGE 07088]